MSLQHKTRYDTPPHSRAALDVMRAVAWSLNDREEVRRVALKFLVEDVEAADPVFAKKMHELVGQLRSRP